MATGINLTNSFQERKADQKKERLLTGGMAIAIIILLMTFAALFATKWYGHGLNVRLTALKNQIAAESQHFDNEQANRLVDFYERLRIMGGAQRSANQEPARILQEFERTMVPGVVLTAYRQTNDHVSGATTVVAEADADNLDAMAKQILRVKQSSLFSGVTVGESVRTTEGKIKFTMTVSVRAPMEEKSAE